MQKLKILVTGSGGQLGRSIKDIAVFYPDFEFFFLSRQDMPVEQKAETEAVFDTIRPQFCINCAAYTAVDKAESDEKNAFLINAEGVKILADACAARQVKFLHISTDYVFNGRSPIPYKEEAEVDPINVYGASKARGEALSMLHNAETIIIRTSWVYSEYGNNFVKTMKRLIREKEELSIVKDQVGAPTYAKDLAHAIMHIINSRLWLPGIYHYCNEGNISWYDFAMAIKDIAGGGCILHPVPATAYPTPARRPSFSLLDTSKIRETYGVNIPAWKESLRMCIYNMQQT